MARYSGIPIRLGDLTDRGIVWDFGPSGVTLRDLTLCGDKQFIHIGFDEAAKLKVIEDNLDRQAQTVRLPDGKPVRYEQ